LFGFKKSKQVSQQTPFFVLSTCAGLPHFCTVKAMNDGREAVDGSFDK
jgi:hypothetical protein